MQLAHQPTIITRFCQPVRDQPVGIMGWEFVVAITVNGDRAWIHAAEETGPAGCADWRLHKSMRQRDRFAHELIETRRVDVWITERADGVKALLIGTIP